MGLCDFGNYCMPKLISKQVSKEAKIRNRFNQVTHLTQDTKWESDKNTLKHNIQESQVANLFPAGNHKAAMKSSYKSESRTFSFKVEKSYNKTVIDFNVGINKDYLPFEGIFTSELQPLKISLFQVDKSSCLPLEVNKCILLILSVIWHV